MNKQFLCSFCITHSVPTWIQALCRRLPAWQWRQAILFLHSLGLNFWLLLLYPLGHCRLLSIPSFSKLCNSFFITLCLCKCCSLCLDQATLPTGKLPLSPQDPTQKAPVLRVYPVFYPQLPPSRTCSEFSAFKIPTHTCIVTLQFYLCCGKSLRYFFFSHRKWNF